MEDCGVLKMVFELHHRQLAEAQARIHALTERTVGLLTLVTGWAVLGPEAAAPRLRMVLLLALAAVPIAACVMHWFYHRGYSRIARVVGKLNTQFGLHDQDKYIPGETIYPEEWRTYGARPVLRSNMLIHWSIILVMGVLSIAATATR